MNIKKQAQLIFQKPFILVAKQKDFKKLKNQFKMFPDISQLSSSSKSQELKDRRIDIVIPKFQKVVSVSHKKLVSPIQESGYFRLRYEHILPKQDCLQLTEQDLVFIEVVLKKKYFSYNFELTPEQISQIFLSLQKNYYCKKITLYSKISYIICLLQFKISASIDSYSLQQKVQFKNALEEIIQYWKNKKKLIRFPLSRMNWPRTQETMRKYPFWIPYKKRKARLTMLTSLNQQIQKKLLLNRQRPSQKKVKEVLSEVEHEFTQYEQISILHNHQKSVFECQMLQFYKNCQQIPFKIQIPGFIQSKFFQNEMDNKKQAQFQSIKFKYLKNNRFLKKSHYSDRIFKLCYDKTPYITIWQNKCNYCANVVTNQSSFNKWASNQISPKQIKSKAAQSTNQV